MGWKTALASLLFPGLGHIINGQSDRAIAIWTGLTISLLLFPLPVFGSITFLGVYLAGIADAYNPDNHIDSIHLKNWGKSGSENFSKLKQRFIETKN